MDYLNSFFKDSLSRISIERLKNKEYLTHLIKNDKEKINIKAIKEHFCEIFSEMHKARIDFRKFYIKNPTINDIKENVEKDVIRQLESEQVNQMDDIVKVFTNYHRAFDQVLQEIPSSGNTTALLMYTLTLDNVLPSAVLFYHEFINADLKPNEAESLVRALVTNGMQTRKNYNSIKTYQKPKMFIQLLFLLHKHKQLKQVNFDALIDNLRIGVPELYEMEEYRK